MSKNLTVASEVKVFENIEFGSVRTVEENGTVLFCGSDVAKALGYAIPRKAILDHCKGVLKRNTLTNGGKQEMSFIPEGDVYRLITHSKLPSAQKFEHWIFDEVLPTIRKTGGYVANDEMFVETYMPFADELTKTLFRNVLGVMRQQTQIINTQEEQIKQQTERIETDRPLVEFASHVSNTSDLIDIGALAKIAKDEHIEIGRTRLFDWLRSNGYLIKSGVNKNQPYQRYIEQGLFKIKEYVYATPYGNKIGIKTYVTGKGQIYFIEKLRNLFAGNGGNKQLSN